MIPRLRSILTLIVSVQVLLSAGLYAATIDWTHQTDQCHPEFVRTEAIDNYACLPAKTEKTERFVLSQVLQACLAFSTADRPGSTCIDAPPVSGNEVFLLALIYTQTTSTRL
jgi:hypothetical protein